MVGAGSDHSDRCAELVDRVSQRLVLNRGMEREVPTFFEAWTSGRREIANKGKQDFEDWVIVSLSFGWPHGDANEPGPARSRRQSPFRLGNQI